MKIEFIKWMVGYAGWEWVEPFENEVVSMTAPSIQIDQYDMLIFIAEDFEKSVWFHMLLQRAIEGVNKEHFNNGSAKKPIYIEIHIDKYDVVDWRIKDDYNYFYFSAKMDHDRAKEKALKYIYEQEKDK